MLYFLDFTHVPPSRYLFQGADLEKCTLSDTPNSSSGSSDITSVNHVPQYKGSSMRTEDQQPDVEGCDGMTLEEKLPLQEKSNDITSPSIHQANSTETRNISNYNEVAVHDKCEPANKKPRLD